MRIIVVEPLGQGGLIHYSYHMCRALARRGADVTLVTSTDYELEGLEHPFRVDNWLKLWNAREPRPKNNLYRSARRVWRGFKFIRELFRLHGYLNERQPDAILFGEVRFGFEYYLFNRLKRAGLVLGNVVHDVRMYDTSESSSAIVRESQALYQQYSRIYQQFDALFVHDRTNYDLFLEIYDVPEKFVYEIPLGTNEIMLEMEPASTPDDLRARFGIADDERIVLFFGTIAKYKGIEDLLQCYKTVWEATGARLFIAGFPSKDTSVESLKALAGQNNIEDAIIWWLDYVPNDEVVPLMALSDVVVLPYRAISQSAVIQISNACGRPAVATRIGGLQDVIEDGKSGVLVEPENPQALAEGIIRVLEDPETAARMGERARELSQTVYSWDRVAEIVLEAFEKAQHHES